MGDPPEEPTIQLRGSDPKHIAKIYSMLEDMKVKEPTQTPPPPVKSVDSEELEKYRELERQNILKELPKDIQEEFKEKSLDQVKIINKAYQSFAKKDVGQTPPSTDATPQTEDTYGWNPLKGKNEFQGGS